MVLKIDFPGQEVGGVARMGLETRAESNPYLCHGIAKVKVLSAEEHLYGLGLLVDVVVGEGGQQLQQPHLHLLGQQVVPRVDREELVEDGGVRVEVARDLDGLLAHQDLLRLTLAVFFLRKLEIIHGVVEEGDVHLGARILLGFLDHRFKHPGNGFLVNLVSVCQLRKLSDHLVRLASMTEPFFLDTFKYLQNLNI